MSQAFTGAEPRQSTGCSVRLRKICEDPRGFALRVHADGRFTNPAGSSSRARSIRETSIEVCHILWPLPKGGISPLKESTFDESHMADHVRRLPPGNGIEK